MAFKTTRQRKYVMAKLKGKEYKQEYPKESKKEMVYHGRKGKPEIHLSKSGREYIMVRKRGGGTKRLYLKDGEIPEKYRESVEHREKKSKVSKKTKRAVRYYRWRQLE